MSDSGPVQDLNHPIPRLDTLDTVLESQQGARIGIVVASPLRDDGVSLARFEQKLRVTLDFFSTDAFLKRCGPATQDHCAVYIDTDARSDASMIDLVFSQADRIRSAGAKPVIGLINAT